MMKKPFVIYFCAIAYFSTGVDAKICERIEAVTRMVEVTFSTAYIATYHGQCYYRCIKTRWATSVHRRYNPKSEWKTIKYCCSGYIRTDDSSNDSDIVCEPICMPACKNGHCRAPAECACETGYILDPKDSHNCLPSCEEGCDHGACVAPHTCRCDFGYTLVNTTCLPVCTEPCHNGTCVAPETCECLSGFRKSEKNLCEPYCSNGCDNGFCTAPETCRCHSGWHIQEGQDVPNKHCEPICSKPCDNGTCVAPETCECKGWYRKSKSGICEPECTSSCGNGTCIAPQKCSCFPGYHINSTNTVFSLHSDHHAPVCIPTCALCKDEDCVAPNKCLPIEILRTTRQLPDYMIDDYDVIDDELSYDDYFPDHFFNSYFETNKRVTSKSAYSDDTKTERLTNPFHRSTLPDDTNTDIMGSGTSPTDDINTISMKNDFNTRSHDTSTKSVNYPFDKSTRSYDTTTVTGSVKNPNNTSTHSDDTINTGSRKSMSWLQQHWVSIFIPVLVIIMAAVVMLLVWRWTPIIIFFKGRSYVVEGDPVDSNGPRPFEDIQISAINEKEKTAQK